MNVSTFVELSTPTIIEKLSTKLISSEISRTKTVFLKIAHE